MAAPPTAEADNWTDVSPEEMAELEQAAAEAQDEVREGRSLPAEKFFADRGIPYLPT